MVKYRQEADNANTPITRVKEMNKFFILRDCIKELEEQLIITDVMHPFKVINVELFDYSQITVINEQTKKVICHMYIDDSSDITEVKRQAEKIANALNCV